MLNDVRRIAKQPPLEPVIPTVGQNYMSFKEKSILWTIWDVGGQHALRDQWKHYFPECDAIVYVVDGSNGDRLDESLVELKKIIAHEDLEHVVVALVANKQDKKTCLSAKALSTRFKAEKILGGLAWTTFGTSAKDHYGMLEILEWLDDVFKSNPAAKARLAWRKEFKEGEEAKSSEKSSKAGTSHHHHHSHHHSRRSSKEGSSRHHHHRSKKS